MRKRIATLAAAAIAAMGAIAAPSPKVCVFVPGVVSGSPIYEQLVAGAKRAVSDTPGATLKVVEGGFDQADWLGKISALAASGEFSLIVSSNAAIPDLCSQAAASFPAARFFIADSWLPGNKSIYTVLYNQLDQGYMVGYLAGLASSGKLPGSSATHKAGLIVAQHYPSFDKLIAPGFEMGLKAADPAAVLETRVLGNWYDATKAAELANGLFDAGAAAILPIAGGAGQGVVSAAASRGRYALWFDDDSGYKLAPGTVIGCAVLRQEKLVYERVKTLLAQGPGSKLYGTADIVGAKEGYVDFAADDPSYQNLPASVRAALDAQVAKLKSGALVLRATGL